MRVLSQNAPTLARRARIPFTGVIASPTKKTIAGKIRVAPAKLIGSRESAMSPTITRIPPPTPGTIRPGFENSI